MKKIFLTMSRGSIARNILQNDFFLRLREECNIVMLTPASNDLRFQKEFGHANVTFLPLNEVDHSFGDRILFFFHKYLIYNETVEQKARWGLIGTKYEERPAYLSYLAKKIIFLPLSKVKFLRDIARLIDFMLLQKKEVSYFIALLEREKPEAVVLTNISADTESALIKATRKKKIPTIGMPKSWDSLSKVGLRVNPDVLVVWNEFMKGQAKDFDNYKADEIKVVGIPQFDYYTDTSRLWSREKFCEVYGLDPLKKIIFFGSEGKTFPSDTQTAELLASGLDSDKLDFPSQLLIRPHYGYKNDEKKFSSLFGRNGVVVDLFNNPSPFFRDEWDYSNEFMDRFLNTLYHSDVIINSCSTLALDGAAFDKPIIHIMFEGNRVEPYERSIKRWYETHYYQAILKTNASIEAGNPEELFDAINLYLKEPSFKSAQRAALRLKFCGKCDGLAGKRFAEAVLALI